MRSLNIVKSLSSITNLYFVLLLFTDLIKIYNIVYANELDNEA